MNSPKSREAVVLYGYIVVCASILMGIKTETNHYQAATVLPFAGPALKKTGRDAG